MSTTASNYLSRINEKFPVKGQDNDSQGFRDNFLNIKRSLDTLNSDIEDLDKNTVKVNGSSTFFGNTIDDVNLKNFTVELVEYELLSGYIELDLSLGNYHKFEVSSGYHEISVSNWPTFGKLGKITVSITTSEGVQAQINFSKGQSLGPDQNPFVLLGNQVTIFEVWKEGDTETIYIKKLNDFIFDGSTTTTKVWVDQLLLGNINDIDSSNLFYTGTNNVTVVTHDLKFGELALIPNRITVNLTSQTDSAPHYSFYVNTLTGSASFIQQGATFTFDSTVTNQIFTVTNYNTVNGKVDIATYTTPAIPDDVLTSSTSVTFINPRFETDYPSSYPTVVTMATQAANTETGASSNYKGSIYADRNRLEVAFNDYGNNNTNTFVITTPVTATNVYNTSTDIINAAFAHALLPYGAIIMWYGSVASVPYGWSLCDGTDGTPDLRDRFIVGAGNSYAVGATGGTTATTVVSHNHTGFVGSTTLTVSQMPTHSHLPATGNLFVYADSPALASDIDLGGAADAVIPNRSNAETGEAGGGQPHTHSLITEPAQDFDNRPPYYALCYIMKKSGL